MIIYLARRAEVLKNSAEDVFKRASTDESGNKIQHAARDTVKRFSPVARISVPQIRILSDLLVSFCRA